MKIRTLSKLQDHLDKEFSWRLKEIAAMKTAVRSSASMSQSTLIRAGIPLLYAHWEGFVKKSAEAYVIFVSCQGLRLNQLSSNFVTLGVKKHIQSLADSRKAKTNIEVVNFFREGLTSNSPLSLSSGINTESNLSSSVFENIAQTVGIDTTSYQTRYNFIDSSLLDRRNNIAHGEYLELDASLYLELSDELISLLRAIKTDIENLATIGSYRLPSK